MFPKTGDVQSIMFFDEWRNKLFITFNYQITVMSMKADNRDRVLTHEKPVTAAIYNSTYNQVWQAIYTYIISAGSCGTLMCLTARCHNSTHTI